MSGQHSNDPVTLAQVLGGVSGIIRQNLNELNTIEKEIEHLTAASTATSGISLSKIQKIDTVMQTLHEIEKLLVKISALRASHDTSAVELPHDILKIVNLPSVRKQLQDCIGIDKSKAQRMIKDHLEHGTVDFF